MNDGMGSAGTGRQVINSNLDIQNLVDLKEPQGRELMASTLTKIADLLIPHCGPHSKFGMIISNTSAPTGGLSSPNIFTKDGIKLLETIEFASVIQSHLKNTITYIGREVDRSAKDGTTTAMILAALFLKYCIAGREEIDDLRLTTFEQDMLYREAVKMIHVVMNEEAYSLERLMLNYPDKDEKYCAGLIAFMQSMSSSGGNLELSKCMRTIFSAVTKDSWELQTWFKSRLENDTPYSIYTEEYDYKLGVDFQTMTMYNSSMQTEWVKENVRVLAIPEVVTSADTNFRNITDYINQFPKDQSLCIILGDKNPELVQLVQKLNGSRIEPIALAFYFTKERQFTPFCLDLAVLCAVASIKPYVQNEMKNPLTDDYTFMVKKIKQFGSEMQFFGLFDHDPTLPTIHPNYKDPNKCAYYTELMTQLRYHADYSKIEHHKDQMVYNKSISALRAMVCLHLPTLQLGGTTHDILANELVTQDVVGATMAAITNGFFINGTLTMREVLEKVKNKIQDDNYVKPDEDKKFMLFIVNQLDRAIEQIVRILYCKNIHTQDNTMVLNIPTCRAGEYYNALVDHNVACDLDMFIGYVEAEEDSYISFDYPVIQPVMIYQEILNRVGEVLIKLMATDKVIVPGGVYINR